MSNKEENSSVAIGEIEQGPSQLELFLEKNQKPLMFAVIALFVIIAGYIIVTGLGDNKKTTASAAYLDASEASDYEQVASQYAGTPAGGTALLSLAEVQSESGDVAKAIETLKQFTDGYTDHPAYPSALLSLASHLTESGKGTEAATFLKEVVELDDATYTPLAQLIQSEVHAKNGEVAEAIELLEELKELSTDDLGNLRDIIQSRIDVLTSPAPAEVQPTVLPASSNEPKAGTTAE